MLHGFLLSIGQLGDRRILAVFAKSILLTLALLATVGVGLWWGARALVLWLGGGGDYAAVAGALAVIGEVLLGWLLFRALAVAAVGVFADDVVEAVEAEHYPEALKNARPVPLWEGAMMGLRAAGRTLLINLALVPAYLLLIITGVGTPIAFFVVNAWLLGRDLGDMVAARHMDRAAMAAFRRETRVQRWLLGAGGTALLLVPFVNFLAPVLGAATATHMFHRRLEA